ncbi:MAG: AIR synthase-related protein, partial [Mucilaginibacter sp.]
LGFEIESDSAIRKDAFLFGEAQGRVVVSISPEEQERFIELMATSEIDFSLLGTVSNGYLTVDEESFGNVIDIKLVYDNVLHVILGE